MRGSNGRCRFCKLAAVFTVLASVLAGVSACDAHLPTSPARLDNPLLLARSPQQPAVSSEGTDLTVGAASPSAAATTGTNTTSVSPVAGPASLPEGWTMPQAFDAILGVNFTSQSCPDFFTTFLADSDFKACNPLSLLLDTSSSFFKAMQNSTILPPVMDQICSTDEATCSGVMDNFAVQIAQTAHCGQDLAQGNALAVSALNGFQNYKLFREVGCLKDESTQEYCFAEAANATTASDLYLYYLPGGTSLPSGTQPTCDSCSRNLMNAFSNYATNSTLRLSQTYASARNLVSLSCGPSFAPLVAATHTSSSASTAQTSFLFLLFATSLLILGSTIY